MNKGRGRARGRAWGEAIRWTVIIPAAVLAAGCLVDRKCFRDDDCPAPKVCGGGGDCELECTVGEDCEPGFECSENRCTPAQVEVIECPEDMGAVGNAFCMDRYEASRPDATETSEGAASGAAQSVRGVIPWTIESNEAALEACTAAGKRLCSPQEWEYACQGPERLAYTYGNTYSPSTCNGIDLFGPESYALLPTGSLPGCVNAWSIYDLSGNMWEHVAGGDSTRVRGGSYKSFNSIEEHRCDYVPMDWIPCACSLGFRCCLTPDSP